jgi:hypothetical protein
MTTNAPDGPYDLSAKRSQGAIPFSRHLFLARAMSQLRHLLALAILRVLQRLGVTKTRRTIGRCGGEATQQQRRILLAGAFIFCRAQPSSKLFNIAHLRLGFSPFKPGERYPMTLSIGYSGLCQQQDVNSRSSESQ